MVGDCDYNIYGGKHLRQLFIEKKSENTGNFALLRSLTLIQMFIHLKQYAAYDKFAVN